MRITGGIGKGRKLRVPTGDEVRPTSDKVKQALFNILGDLVTGAVFLDLYAGAGSVGLEALSRGADRAVFVDSSRESLQAIKVNIDQLGFNDRAQIVDSKARAYLGRKSGPFDLVFMDPPYADELQPLLDLIGKAGILKPDAVVIAEHVKKQSSPERAGMLTLYRVARYGDTVLAFYRPGDTPEESV